MSQMRANWNELGAVFSELAEKSAPERARELNRIQLEDAALAAELSSLLQAHDSADGFFEKRIERIFVSLSVGFTSFAAGIDLGAGERLLHFEILELLGEGSQAKVYLARDTELERLIALKVTLNPNKEARTLAHFALDGIIQIYSEHLVEREGQTLRLMCLQFVAGPTLARLAQELRVREGAEKSFVQLLEAFPQRHVALEPAALKWRERLATLTLPEAIARIGIRLAEILDHAHERGVLHLDIKPANILIDSYGRPYLSDFNVSANAELLRQGDMRGVGGTPYYMPPEQSRLFADGPKASPASVDARSDVYALGIVLKDLFRLVDCGEANLQRILARATASDQSQRTLSAKQLSDELGGWLRSRLVEKEMPPLGRGFRWILSHPMLAFASLTLVSQIIASLINIGYNHFQIVAVMSEAQNRIFLNCVLVYNLITYPLMSLLGVYAIYPLFQTVPDVLRARRSALRIPLVSFLAVSFGWLPGAWIFPFVIEQFAGPVSSTVYQQFIFSFSLAWLISMTTTLAISIFVLTRALYPKYWEGQSDLAVRELRGCERLNRLLIFASALIPMAGILLAVLVAPLGHSPTDFHSFKIFLLVIVGFGLINLLLIQRLTRLVDAIFATLKRPRAVD